MPAPTLDNLKARFRGWLLARKCISALLDQPHLWRWNRRGVARGAAVGVFLGFVLPFGQIPASAVCAKYLRLNLPVTVAGTWITNPITTVPIYYAIYLFGVWLLGPMASAPAGSMEAGLLDRVTSVSIPILVATPIVALACAPLTYAAVSFAYRIRVRRRHRRQRTLRSPSI
jgi:uncharacterized protein (DUF2062 family)